MMIKKVILCLTLVLLLAACAKTPESSNTTAAAAQLSPGSAANSEAASLGLHPGEWNQSCGVSIPLFCELPEGYFYYGYISQDPVNRGILFCPRGSDTFIPLCAKPNCKHDDENCDAYAGSMLSFGYYDGAFYYMDIHWLDTVEPVNNDCYDLVKMNLDGTNHHTVGTVDLTGYPPSTIRCIYHGGKLFLLLQADLDLPLEEQVDHLLVVDLTDGSVTEPAEDFIQKAGLPHFLSLYRDKLYGWGNEQKHYYLCAPEDLGLLEINTLTGEVRTPLPQRSSRFYVTDATWYYYVAEESETEAQPAGFYEYDLKSGTIREYGKPIEDMSGPRWDEDFIYTYRRFQVDDIGKQALTMYVLSRDYKLLDQVEIEPGVNYLCAASDRILFCSRAFDRLYYVDKSEIGSGGLTLKPMKMPTRPVAGD